MCNTYTYTCTRVFVCIHITMKHFVLVCKVALAGVLFITLSLVFFELQICLLIVVFFFFFSSSKLL